jgi:spore coat polysaccharide biosynthesis protein SpsF (cytidylyltransferase family)
MNFDIFIPVRLDSKRFPKKALQPILGKPIIINLIERLSSCKNIRKIIVCTTKNPSDDLLVDLLKDKEIAFFRGDEKDILSRFLIAAKLFKTDFIVNVDGDDIYTTTDSIDNLIEQFYSSYPNYLYYKNLPLGLTPVGFDFKSLEIICKLKKTNDTETGYRNFFLKNSNIKQLSIDGDKLTKFPKNLRLTLDYKEDNVLAQKVFSNLGNSFQWKDLEIFFETHPEFVELVSHLEQKWKNHWNKNLSDYTLKK